ncbi:thioredoxin domain-containing protein [Kitasatospora sp. GAS204B]|uniref:DsbA family protein n=1 Tax=unclassified Kitasatospora TaxID=2633591 RepID=UPI0024753039|nr:thioredoxin domain-containing protein [Kitasatospora sp. GAS204B]MDH6116189.1 protein-disulfide isomerase [Kitasatospora sp. GAS204B]
MSNKSNKSQQSYEQKSADRRAKLHEARQREQRAATVRRRIVIGASAVVVLALCGGVAIAVNSGGGHSGGSAAASAPVVVPANAGGPNGTVVTYGKADAAHTLDVYEDFRCPICKKFETSDGQTVQQLADNGTYKIQYHMAAFLDDNLGGKGSIQALAAAGAALNQSVDDFKKFHDALYANQPSEQTDGYGDVNTILNVAGQVPGLKTDAFVNAVKAGTYLPWAQQVATAFNSSGVTGTPTMKLDGKQLAIFDSQGTPVTADQYTALIQQSAGTK